ncbi:hypothetical protein FH508_0012995 [Lysinibacillus sp. CD3-6]|uniref:hypothetical protein n=1 Tax=Lysinibacillus sp. CD3-6 TaxID=2892541 RepID=UPI0011742079|nr:hypothetical protein [Lysinibacillus sp. CD3-6]UED78382.1 hypothetical protein FH508_0012995 [Lysinibacillus sp. CD3-6]
MKSFDYEKNKKIIKKETNAKLFTLAEYIFIMIILGLFCYFISFVVSIWIFQNLSIWEVYKQIFTYGTKGIEETLAGYSILLFSILSTFSALIYAFILKLLKKLKKFRNNYEDLREQIYDLLTMLIFIFGFLPLMLKFSLTKYETLLGEVDKFFLIFLIGVLPPYLYSSLSKIYYATAEKQFSKSLINHMEKKINNK